MHRTTFLNDSSNLHFSVFRPNPIPGPQAKLWCESLHAKGVMHQTTKRGAVAEDGQQYGRCNNDKRARTTNQFSFIDILAECGCQVEVGDDDVYTFEVADSRKLRQCLERRLALDKPLYSAFVANLTSYLDQPGALLAALQPDKIALPLTAIFGGDSMIRILLNVPTLQPDLIDTLLHKLVDDAVNQKTTDTTDDISKLILGHFRWLNRLQGTGNIVQSLLTLLPQATVDLQREIISLLPEIVGEDTQAIVVDALTAVIFQDSTLAIPILEATSMLCLSNDLHSRILKALANSMEHALPEDVAFVVQHLFQDVQKVDDCIEQTLRPFCSQWMVSTCVSESCFRPAKLFSAMVNGIRLGGEPTACAVQAFLSSLSKETPECDTGVIGASILRRPNVFDFTLLLAFAHVDQQSKGLGRALHLVQSIIISFGNKIIIPWLEDSFLQTREILSDNLVILMHLAEGLLLLYGGASSLNTPHKKILVEAGQVFFAALFCNLPQASYGQQQMLISLDFRISENLAKLHNFPSEFLPALSRIARDKAVDVLALTCGEERESSVLFRMWKAVAGNFNPGQNDDMCWDLGTLFANLSLASIALSLDPHALSVTASFADTYMQLLRDHLCWERSPASTICVALAGAITLTTTIDPKQSNKSFMERHAQARELLYSEFQKALSSDNTMLIREICEFLVRRFGWKVLSHVCSQDSNDIVTRVLYDLGNVILTRFKDNFTLKTYRVANFLQTEEAVIRQDSIWKHLGLMANKKDQDSAVEASNSISDGSHHGKLLLTGISQCSGLDRTSSGELSGCIPDETHEGCRTLFSMFQAGSCLVSKQGSRFEYNDEEDQVRSVPALLSSILDAHLVLCPVQHTEPSFYVTILPMEKKFALLSVLYAMKWYRETLVVWVNMNAKRIFPPGSNKPPTETMHWLTNRVRACYQLRTLLSKLNGMTLQALPAEGESQAVSGGGGGGGIHRSTCSTAPLSPLEHLGGMITRFDEANYIPVQSCCLALYALLSNNSNHDQESKLKDLFPCVSYLLHELVDQCGKFPEESKVDNIPAFVLFLHALRDIIGSAASFLKETNQDGHLSLDKDNSQSCAAVNIILQGMQLFASLLSHASTKITSRGKNKSSDSSKNRRTSAKSEQGDDSNIVKLLAILSQSQIPEKARPCKFDCCRLDHRLSLVCGTSGYFYSIWSAVMEVSDETSKQKFLCTVRCIDVFEALENCLGSMGLTFCSTFTATEECSCSTALSLSLINHVAMVSRKLWIGPKTNETNKLRKNGHAKAVRLVIRWCTDRWETIRSMASCPENLLAEDEIKPAQLPRPFLIACLRINWDEFTMEWKRLLDCAAKIDFEKEACKSSVPRLANQLKTACQVFSELVAACCGPDSNHAMHVAAAMHATKVLNFHSKLFSFWTLSMEYCRDDVMTSIKSLQRGTRSLHTLCAEGKVRRDVGFVSRVPLLKKAIEKFTLNAVAFLQGCSSSEVAVEFGELKHRDLQGNELKSSQMYPPSPCSSSESDSSSSSSSSESDSSSSSSSSESDSESSSSSSESDSGSSSSSSESDSESI